MNRIKAIFSGLALCLCLNAVAQTPAETKLYNKTLSKPTVKAFDKFLAKYPESVYYQEIRTLRDSCLFVLVDKDDAAAVRNFASMYPDSPLKDEVEGYIRLHNTSAVTRAEAVKIAGGEAVGWKMDNVDYVVGVSVAGDGNFVLSTYSMDGKKTFDDRTISRYELSPPAGTRLVDSLCVVDFNSRNMLTFSYINEAGEGEQEYVVVLYDYHNDNVFNAMFYGSSLSEGEASGGYAIEGQCPETLSGGVMSAEQMWTVNRIGSNPSLKPIAKADLLTNESIKWWKSRNPNAESSASLRLNFGILDPESSLVREYEKAAKEKGDKYNAAYFDLRGYTVIVAFAKSSGEYLLVWCEPVCKDRKTDRLLKNIYFEGNGTSSLAMFYYQGKKSFKYRVNLAEKTLRK